MDFFIKEFEELSLDQFYEIAKSRFEVFVEEQKITEQEFDGVDKESYHLVGVSENRVVAYCRIIPKGIAYSEVSIGRVLVLSKYRNKKIANEMMKKAILFIKNTLKEDKITISAQEYIIPFYEGLGFRKISETYMEAGIPHVKMKLDIL